MLIRRARESGFTLIETLAAITVFTIMTLGVAPLLAASIRGSTVARSDTVGKNVASQAMERVRGLPYFVNSTSRVDVLDLYFPDSAGAVGGVYTTTCAPADASSECPLDGVPPNHTMTYQAAFVELDDSVAAGDPEEYEVVAPPAGYEWDTATQAPGSLLRMVITVSWPVGNETRTYDLTSLIGDRRFGGLKVDGSAVIEQGVRISTAFRSSSGQESALSVVAGTSQSRIESRLLTTADQDVSAARLLLTDRTVPLDASNEVTGATAILAAPPSDSIDGSISTPTQELGHGDLGGAVVAGVASSSYADVEADVTDDNPQARAEHEIGTDAGALASLWVDAQADDSVTSPLRLDDRDLLAWLRPDPEAAIQTTALSASTDATTADLTAQEVSTNAAIDIGSFLLLPTTFIPADVSSEGAEGAVVEVRGFEAEVDCLARPLTRGGGSATATWSATLRYWQDPADEGDDDDDGDDDEVRPGSYAEVVLGGAAGAGALEAIQSDPPMVYEDPQSADPLGSPDDIYLFEPPAGAHAHASHADDDNDPLTPIDNDADNDPLSVDIPELHDHEAYLADWQALNATTVNEAQDQVTSASISNAIQITTTPTAENLLESVLNVTFGVLSCDALDAR